MIIVTGAAGFIGSCLVGALNHDGYKDIILVDDFSRKDKAHNYNAKDYSKLVDREELVPFLKENESLVQYVFHLGARTDTTSQDLEIFEHLNLDYSKQLFSLCAKFGIPFLYASSASTYGDGKHGFSDELKDLSVLEPQNPYAHSKHDFDIWVEEQESRPPQVVGLKFFNVYGPNEYHKSRMASVIFHSFNQIRKTGKMKLFRSHRSDFEDGQQLRDFIYVKDVVKVLIWLMENRKVSGLFNLGTGSARTFNDLVLAVFQSLEIEPDIEFIDIPIDIREGYQYFTEASMNKLRDAGFKLEFTSLEDGVNDYVLNYLIKGIVY